MPASRPIANDDRAPSVASEYALDVGNLNKTYDAAPILSNLSLRVEKGRTLSIIGPSGAGKSTLARCVCGLEPYSSGRILIDGADLQVLLPDAVKRSRHVGLIFQQFNLWPHLSARENVAFSLRRTRGMKDKDADDVAVAMLDRVHLGHHADRRPGSLSGGEQQRVAIARALALSPSLLVFDEPTSALDPELVGEVLGIMKEFSGGGMAMLVITHEMNFAREVSDKVAFMSGGEVVECSPPDIIFSSSAALRTQLFLRRLLVVGVDGSPACGIDLTNSGYSGGSIRLQQGTQSSGIVSGSGVYVEVFRGLLKRAKVPLPMAGLNEFSPQELSWSAVKDRLRESREAVSA